MKLRHSLSFFNTASISNMHGYKHKKKIQFGRNLKLLDAVVEAVCCRNDLLS